MTVLVSKDIRFAMVPEWVLLNTDLSPQAIRLYLVLDRHADKDDRTAYPSRARLGELLGVSAKTVDRALAELIAVGAVTAEKRYDLAGDPTTNRYLVHVVPPEGVAPRMTPPPDMDDHGGSPTDVATGSPTDVPLNESHLNDYPQPPAVDTDGHVIAVQTLSKQPPNPQPSAGGASCAKHPDGHPNCRACGTTTRQVGTALVRQALAAKRERELARRRQEAAAAREARADSTAPEVQSVLEQTRQRLSQGASA